MSMKRTIYEVPAYMQQHFVKLAEENGLLFTQSKTSDHYTEIEITHDKQQDYILKLIERDLNSNFIDPDLAQAG